MMKLVKWMTGFMFLSLTVFTGLTSCSDDDDPKSDKEEITGQWNIDGFSTDNQTLNVSLGLILTVQGIQITDGTITFGEDGVAHLSIPYKGNDPIEYSPVYEYIDSQLAFRFDEILPVPFNCDVTKLTNNQMNIEAFLSPTIMTLLVEALKVAEPEIAGTVETLLGSSMTSGLTITIQLGK